MAHLFYRSDYIARNPLSFAQHQDGETSLMHNCPNNIRSQLSAAIEEVLEASTSPVSFEIGALQHYYVTRTVHNAISFSESTVIMCTLNGSLASLPLVFKFYDSADTFHCELAAYHYVSGYKDRIPSPALYYASAAAGQPRPFIVIGHLNGVALSECFPQLAVADTHANYTQILSMRYRSILEKLRMLPRTGKCTNRIASLSSYQWYEASVVDIRSLILAQYDYLRPYALRLDLDSRWVEEHMLWAQLETPNSATLQTLCHGDLWPANILWESELDRLVGIVDWEYAFLGPQERDIADLTVGILLSNPAMALETLLNIAQCYDYNTGLLRHFLIASFFVQLTIQARSGRSDLTALCKAHIAGLRNKRELD